MSLFDLSLILRWWLIYLVLGVICLPLITIIFKNFFDKGYIFTKVLGSIILSYFVFIFSELHLITFSTNFIYFVLITLIFLSFLLAKQTGFNFKKLPLRFIFFEEFLFLIMLFFWSSIRTFQPDIHGLEKFMDFGFLNSILKTRYLPPVDLWYPPFTINYYYFGHLTTAVLTKLTNLDSKYTFNLMIATIFSLCFSLSFSIGGNLIYLNNTFKNYKIVLNRKLKFIIIISALLSAFLITFGGNLHTIYAFFKAYDVNSPIPFWQLKFLPKSFPNSYWYPNATRFIYHTIHEFPIYSFVVSDLHGHVLDIPIVLLQFAFFLSIFSRIRNSEINLNKRSSILIFVFEGFLISIMYMTNAWDSLIYLGILGVLIFYFLPISFLKKIIFIIFTFVTYLIFSLPFSLFFQPFAIASQIGMVCSPNFLINIGHLGPFVFEANHCDHSYWWELLVLYGFFVFNFLSFLFFIDRKKQTFIDEFVSIFSLCAFFLIIIPEFFYLKDIYTTYYRANTMFKLVYQAFIILSITSGFMIVRIITSFKDYKLYKKIIYALFIIIQLILLTLIFIYPFFAVTGYYNNLRTPNNLDGQKYLETLLPYDYKAINWINNNIKIQEVILEAQGDSYTDYERISANTGMPTILGWTVHEWLWRGSYDILVPRITDVQTIYETDSISLTRQLLEKYNVKYIYIGNLEKEKYPTLNENKFQKLGKLIYENPKVKIFQIN